MAAEPIVIYSHKIDPDGVLQILRTLAPDVTVEGPAESWRQATVVGEGRGLPGRWRLSFGHDRNYYASSNFARQMNGMQHYFRRFPENENTTRIMLLIQSLRFALATSPPPEPELELHSDDPRLEYVFAVVKHLDGVIFTRSGLWDANGRLLYGADDPDPEALMPGIYKEVPVVPRSERPCSQQGTIPDPGAAPPPSASRVARRTLALAALTERALLEPEADQSWVTKAREDVLAWVEAVAIGDELEPDEWAVLQRPAGKVPQRDAVNATWRLEGLGVLAWALGRFDLPPCDELVHPANLLTEIGVLDADAGRALLAAPTLRPPDELTQRREQLFAVHWRLTDWRLRHQPMNFAETARTVWFGPMNISGLRLIEDDLAIGELPISRASVDAVNTATSAALERHRAINWLNGGSEIYSQTDVST